MKKIWLWLANLFGISTQDLIDLAIDKVFTPAVRTELTQIIIDVAKLGLSGDKNKLLVIERIMNSRDEIANNVKKLGLEVLSMGINQLVDHLQMQGATPHTGINKGVGNV